MTKKQVQVVKDNTDAILNATQAALIKAALAGGFILEGATKISMSAGSHSGRTYSKRSGKGKHKASAPGETPAVNYGILVNSIKTHLSESSPTKAVAEVGTNVEYGAHLEWGTSKMAARPFLRPAFDNNATKIVGVIQRMFKHAIEGAAK
jgi:HK97 gp10 family phage protein